MGDRSNNLFALFTAIGLVGIVVIVGLMGRASQENDSDNYERYSQDDPPYYETQNEEPEPDPEPQPKALPTGDWVTGSDIKYRVICANYGDNDYDEAPDILQVNFFIESLAREPLELAHRDFVVRDSQGRTFRQLTTYGGNTHFQHMSFLEHINPGTTQKYSMYFDIPDKDTYTFHSAWDDLEYATLDPKNSCLAEIIDSYDLSGVEKRLKEQQSLSSQPSTP